MKRVTAIALNTFREAMRDKVMFILLVFACLLILSSWVLGELSLHEEVRITKDLGLGGISLFGVVLAVFVGVNLVHKEVDRKTIHALIPKPIQRYQFVLGKYLGMVLTLTVQVAAMALVLCLALRVQNAYPDGLLARAIVLLWLQVAVVAALAVLFSTFSTPFLSGLFTTGLFVIGRSTPELHAFLSSRLQGTALAVAERLIALLPDLHLFFVSGASVGGRVVSIHRDYVDWAYVGAAAGYGFAYAVCVLLIAIAIFSRRDFV